MQDKVVIQVRIEKDLKKWLDKKAEQWGTNPSQVVRTILETVEEWEEMGKHEGYRIRPRKHR